MSTSKDLENLGTPQVRGSNEVCTVHFEHSLNFLGERVGRATHASPWHPCSIGTAVHEGLTNDAP